MYTHIISLSLELDIKEFHDGLNEACQHLAVDHKDEYLNGLVKEVNQAREALFGAMYIASIRRGILEESRALNNSIVAAQRYLDLCAFDEDAEVKASAKLLRRQFGAYGKSLAHMRVASRLSAVETVLRDMHSAEWQPHVDHLPELSARLDKIGVAKEALQSKRLEVDQAKSSMVKPEPLYKLKKEAAVRLNTLVGYLQAMTGKDASTYGQLYDGLVLIIKQHNAYQRNLHSKSPRQEKPASELTVSSVCA